MRQFMLTTTLLTSFMLSACGQDVQIEGQDVPAPDITSSEAKLQTPESHNQKTFRNEVAHNEASSSGLSAQGLTPAEQEEFKSLQDKQNKHSQDYATAIIAWQQQSPASRGPQPVWQQTSILSEDERKRFYILQAKTQSAQLRNRYQEYVPKDLSQDELEEFLALHKEQFEFHLEQQEQIQNWNRQDPTSRGRQPDWNYTGLSKEKTSRLSVLQAKISMAQFRKRYEGYVPKYLSQNELDELLTLQRAQNEFHQKQQEKYQNWSQQDPASRGGPPNISVRTQFEHSKRLAELQMKVGLADRAKHTEKRMADALKQHNISFSDSELSELKELEAKKAQLDQAMRLAMQELHKEGGVNSQAYSQAAMLDKIPRHEIRQRWAIEQRIKAIKAPLKAAEDAARIRNNLTQKSQQSGVTLLSSEIDEVIALNAEKRRLAEKAQQESYERWLNDETFVPTSQPVHSDEDYTRLKEIEMRLKAISAPMEEAVNAAREAENPALRQHRLAQEKRQKWQVEWQDKKQAGEIPRDAVMHSPSYAEIQDRTQDYRSKLDTRASKAGVSVSEADIKRLEALNADMLAIRKSVYDMEVDGSAMVEVKPGFKSPDFKLTAGMHKIRMIEEKQREILAALSEAETTQYNSAAQSPQIGTQLYNYTRPILGLSRSNTMTSQALIDSFRQRDMPLSQEDADALLAFEREMENR